MNGARETATLGGGCFWCLEAVYEQVVGVEKVVNGYAGGHKANPTYQEVCDETTGHAEVVQVTFDPSVVTYRELLDVFFSIHDPTTPDRQGNDVGESYRSIILHHDAAQRATAEQVIGELEKEELFDVPVITQLAPLAQFWPAEAYHQGYYRRNPTQGYCRAVISPKVAKFRSKWAAKLKPA